MAVQFRRFKWFALAGLGLAPIFWAWMEHSHLNSSALLVESGPIGPKGKVAEREGASPSPDELENSNADVAEPSALASLDSSRVITDLYTKAVRNPAEVAHIINLLADNNPELAASVGQSLITLFIEKKEHALAVQMALGVVSPTRLVWLGSVFHSWGADEPQKAIVELGCLGDPATREVAFEALISGWSETNPAGLAPYVLGFPSTKDRATAVSHLIPRWIEQDSRATMAWIARADVSPEMDGGIAAVSTQSNFLSQHPETSVSLASTIYDPILRANTLGILGQSWGRADPVALQRFIDSNPAMMDPADRTALSDGLSALPDS